MGREAKTHGSAASKLLHNLSASKVRMAGLTKAYLITFRDYARRFSNRERGTG
jgi:hypothetical protein